MTTAPRPSAPATPRKAPAPKDLVVTALGESRLWATVGQGIVTEVYWPSTGEPQIRDLGFIVAGDGWWAEVKAQADYTVDLADPKVPLGTVVHRGPAEHPYTLTIEVVPDPHRDVLLIGFELTGVGALVYPFLASHLQRHRDTDADQDFGGGADNTAWSDPAGHLLAQGAGRYLCLAAREGFTRMSVGHFGYSDLWHDFDLNGHMGWGYTEAGPGFVVLAGECGSSGTLGLAFADDSASAQTLVAASLGDGIDAARSAVVQAWRDWAAATTLPPAVGDDPPELADALHVCATVVRAHEDRGFPGAIVAGLATPWGDSTNSPGGYHLVWPRDAVESGFALIVLGHVDDAQRLLDYLMTQQQPDGHWHQNFFPDGTPFWQGIQLDETALPVMLAAKLADLGQPVADDVRAMIRGALGYLVANGPLSDQDRWEEDRGGSPFTLGIIVAALVAGAPYLDDADRDYVLALADDWNERIEEWCYVAGSWLDRVFGLQGHYVRIGPDPQLGAARIANQSDTGFTVPSSGVLGLEFAYLARLGLRDPDDQRLQDTTTLVDAMLGRDVGTGVGYYRYNYDGYGEQVDGANFSGTGVGRVWPLLAGERGHYAVLRGESGTAQLAAMLAMRSPTGLLPEQVWDQPPVLPRGGVPSLPLYTGCHTLSAMPLVWAHSELVKLAAVRSSRRPVEMLQAVVDRYGGAVPTPTTSYWRAAVPVHELTAGRDLVVEDTRPFTLHYGHDGWIDVREVDSAPLGLGMHGARLAATDMAGWTSVQFIRRYGPDQWDAAGDQNVHMHPAPLPRLRSHSA